jgi:hypothetical protein
MRSPLQPLPAGAGAQPRSGLVEKKQQEGYS